MLAVALAAVVGAGLVPVGAGALPRAEQATPPDPVPPPLAAPTEAAPPPLGALPEIAPALAGVRLSSEGYDEAVRARDRTRDDLADATERGRSEGGQVLVLTAREEDLRARLGRFRARVEVGEDDVARLAELLREVAASSYVSGARADPLRRLDARGFDDRAKTDVAVDGLATRQVRELETARSVLRRDRDDERATSDERAEVRAGIGAARAAQERAAADETRLAADLREETATAEDESRLAQVAGAGFPLVVLDAYWKAAEAMRVLVPSCGIRWWALAGIGRVESGHGTHAGSEVRADGSLTKPIIGIPLTGIGGTAAIGDSDGGVVDGDPLIDRAAGPMQFIPQTWLRWGRDGNGDGIRDIQNVYDAALGAAGYLCASGPLVDDAGLQRAYFSYNHSLDYVGQVLDGAKRYALGVQI